MLAEKRIGAEPMVVEKQRIGVENYARVLVGGDQVVAEGDAVVLQPRTPAVSKVAGVECIVRPFEGSAVAEEGGRCPRREEEIETEVKG